MTSLSKVRLALWGTAVVVLVALQLYSHIPRSYARIFYVPLLGLLAVVCYLIIVDIFWLLKKRWPQLFPIIILATFPVILISIFLTEGFALLFAPLIVLPIYIPLTVQILVRHLKKTHTLTWLEIVAVFLGLLVIAAAILVFVYISFLSSSGVNIVG